MVFVNRVKLVSLVPIAQSDLANCIDLLTNPLMQLGQGEKDPSTQRQVKLVWTLGKH